MKIVNNNVTEFNKIITKKLPEFYFLQTVIEV